MFAFDMQQVDIQALAFQTQFFVISDLHTCNRGVASHARFRTPSVAIC